MKNDPGIIFLAAVSTLASLTSAGVIKTVEPYTVTYAAGKIQSATGMPERYMPITAGKDYYLDYQVFFESGWEWVKGGKLPGLVEAWLNGEKVVTLGNLKLRGNVGETVALVDHLGLNTFYGGSDNSWAPSKTTRARFSQVIVTDHLPNLSAPFTPINSSSGINPAIGASGGPAFGLNARRAFSLAQLGWGDLSLPPDAGSKGRLRIFDSQGKAIHTLDYNEGGHRWNGLDGANRLVKPGMLLIQVPP